MRTIAADDLWLSPSYDRDSVAAHFTWHPAPELVAPALELVQEALSPFDPRPHWGKVFTAWDPERIESAYPRLPQFRALRDGLDPERHFGNDFVGSPARRLRPHPVCFLPEETLRATSATCYCGPD